MNIDIFRQGYEKPLHYPCTIMAKAKPGCSYDKRLYCDIFSLYYKCEKEWDISDLKDKIEWWCYATDLERYIKQSQKDLEIARTALKEYANKDNWGCIEDDRDRFIHTYWYFDGCDDGGWVSADKALIQIEQKEQK